MIISAIAALPSPTTVTHCQFPKQTILDSSYTYSQISKFGELPELESARLLMRRVVKFPTLDSHGGREIYGVVRVCLLQLGCNSQTPRTK
jgi:hypothetical protein